MARVETKIWQRLELQHRRQQSRRHDSVSPWKYHIWSWNWFKFYFYIWLKNNHTYNATYKQFVYVFVDRCVRARGCSESRTEGQQCCHTNKTKRVERGTVLQLRRCAAGLKTRAIQVAQSWPEAYQSSSHLSPFSNVDWQKLTEVERWIVKCIGLCSQLKFVQMLQNWLGSASPCIWIMTLNILLIQL